MGLKTGPTVKLRNLIQNLKELPCSVNPGNTSECYPCVESRQQEQSNDSNDLMLSTTNTNSLDNFNIMDIMNANVVGEAIVKSFTARPKKYITYRERQDVVRIAVDHIVKLKERCYPSTQTKAKMAKAIVTTFPCLGSVIEPEDTISQPHHLFFNPQFDGFLETRLKAVRNLLLKPKDRKRKHGLGKREGPNEKKLKGICGPSSSSEADDYIVSEEVLSMVDWLKTAPPTPANSKIIRGFMENTFNYREHQMLNEFRSKAASEILTAYPRFCDFNYGSLIFEEFTRQYPTAKSFEQNFILKFRNGLPCLAKREGDAIQESGDECVRLIRLTMKLNPAVKKVKKITFDDKKERIILFRQKENVDIYDVVENRPAEMNQPFLLVLGEETDTNLSFHLVIDKK